MTPHPIARAVRQLPGGHVHSFGLPWSQVDIALDAVRKFARMACLDRDRFEEARMTALRLGSYVTNTGRSA